MHYLARIYSTYVLIVRTCCQINFVLLIRRGFGNIDVGKVPGELGNEFRQNSKKKMKNSKQYNTI